MGTGLRFAPSRARHGCTGAVLVRPGGSVGRVPGRAVGRVVGVARFVAPLPDGLLVGRTTGGDEAVDDDTPAVADAAVAAVVAGAAPVAVAARSWTGSPPTPGAVGRSSDRGAGSRLGRSSDDLLATGAVGCVASPSPESGRPSSRGRDGPAVPARTSATATSRTIIAETGTARRRTNVRVPVGAVNTCRGGSSGGVMTGSEGRRRPGWREQPSVDGTAPLTARTGTALSSRDAPH